MNTHITPTTPAARTKKRLLGSIAALGIGATLAIAAPMAASAHVTVDPGQVEAGGWSYVTFRVPTESDTASTTKLEVHLPKDTPFTHVSYQPTPGWKTAVAQQKLPKPVKVMGNTVEEAPTEVTMTADGSGILPGQVQTFTLSIGPVPDTGHVVIPVTQTYSDGKVVEWKATPEEVAKNDTLEPAPVLWINDAPPAGDHHAGVTAKADAHQGEAAESSSDGGNDSGAVSLGLSIGAIVLAAGGALLAALAFARSRKPQA